MKSLTFSEETALAEHVLKHVFGVIASAPSDADDPVVAEACMAITEAIVSMASVELDPAPPDHTWSDVVEASTSDHFWDTVKKIGRAKVKSGARGLEFETVAKDALFSAPLEIVYLVPGLTGLSLYTAVSAWAEAWESSLLPEVVEPEVGKAGDSWREAIFEEWDDFSSGTFMMPAETFSGYVGYFWTMRGRKFYEALRATRPANESALMPTADDALKLLESELKLGMSDSEARELYSAGPFGVGPSKSYGYTTAPNPELTRDRPSGRKDLLEQEAEGV